MLFLLLAILQVAFMDATHVADVSKQIYPREVGGLISRTYPLDEYHAKNRHSREVGGAITRNNPGIIPKKRDIEEVWTIVQTDEENLTLDSLRGKDVPLSLTEDFRGIEPVLPAQYDGIAYPGFMRVYI